jgi:hypothetical protein
MNKRLLKIKMFGAALMTFVLIVNVLPVKAISTFLVANQNPGQDLQASTFNFAPVADAYVNSDNPSTNYGSLTTLRGDGSPLVRSYLRFNVQGLTGPVTRATLRVFANSSSSGGHDIRSVSSNTWVESTITYANSPVVGSLLGSSGGYGAGAWTNVDITALVTGNGTYNLALTVPGTTAISFASRESGANAPQLIVETTSASTTTPTTTPTLIPPVTSTITPAPIISPTSPPGNLLTFRPTADAYVNSGSPSTNYGSLTTLRGDGSPVVRSYLRFDVQGLNGPVTRATLRIYANSSSNTGHDIRSVSDNSWTETAITYTNAPPVGNVLGASGGYGARVWTNVDVTVYVTGNGTYNLALSVQAAKAVSFASRESGANAPQLIVETGGGSAATPTQTSVSLTPIPSSTSTVLPIPSSTRTVTPISSSTGTVLPIPSSTRTVTLVPSSTNTVTSVPISTSTRTPTPSATAVSGSAVMVGAGDISLCSNNNDELTARLLDGIPGTVFTAGDNVYPNGAYTDYVNCYDPTWGRHKARTNPVPGNHEYGTSGAAGYFQYFNNVPSYYAYNLGAWRIYALNSEISVSASSAQVTWLQADLAANPSLCVMAYWHKPRWSSGSTHGNNSPMQTIWQILYDGGAELVINGHEHNYERFAEMNGSGSAVSQGLREIVVGTGGASLYPFGTALSASQVRNNSTFGVVKLTLTATGYSWQFVPVAGSTFADSGSSNCH